MVNRDDFVVVCKFGVPNIVPKQKNSDILSSPKNKACKTTYFRTQNIYEQLDLSKHKFL